MRRVIQLFKAKNDDNLMEALRINKELIAKLQESDCDIIKLIPNNPDQFYLNGEFIADDSNVVWGISKITYADAVMFKAGKASAGKEFIHTVENLEEENARLSHKCDELAASAKLDLEVKDNLIDKLKRQIDGLNSHITSLTGQYENRVNALQKDVSGLQREIAEQAAEAAESNKPQELSQDITCNSYCKYGHIHS